MMSWPRIERHRRSYVWMCMIIGNATTLIAFVRIGRLTLLRTVPALCEHAKNRHMIRFDPHAEFQIGRRGILRSWIEETLRSWDETEVCGNKRSFLKCYPERGKKLRVVVRENDHEYIITAYFDRKKPCA